MLVAQASAKDKTAPINHITNILYGSVIVCSRKRRLYERERGSQYSPLALSTTANGGRGREVGGGLMTFGCEHNSTITGSCGVLRFFDV